MRKILFITTLFLFALISFPIFAQETDPDTESDSEPVKLTVAEVANYDTLNLEKKFEIAQSMAFEGKREESRVILYNILSQKSDFLDAKLLIARTHAWEENYDSSRTIYRQILKKKKGQKEAVDGLIDINVWQKKYDTALFYCDYGLKHHPKDVNFTLRKAKIYLDKGNTSEAYKQLMIVQAKDSSNVELKKILDDERFILQNDKVQLEYLREWFDEPYLRTWSLGSFSYQNKSKFGTIVGRVYSGTLSVADTSSSGFQIEAEAYPKLDEKHYLYLGASQSPDFFFPKFRIGAEIYRKMEKQSEVSAGVRFLNFGNSNTPIKKVTIYTASFNKYFSDFWVSFRAYYTVATTASTMTYALHGRKYMKSQDSYIFAEYIFGSSPSEQTFLLNSINSTDKIFLKSTKWRVGIQKLFSKRWTFFAAYGSENAEYSKDNFHTVQSFEFRLGYYLPYSL
jgi:YaiO family outer membrane protein